MIKYYKQYKFYRTIFWHGSLQWRRWSSSGAVLCWVTPHLTRLPVVSGSRALTVPITVLTGAFSLTSSTQAGRVKTGGSSESSTTTFTVAVSRQGPPLPGSERRLVASTFSVNAFLLSKSRGWAQGEGQEVRDVQEGNTQEGNAPGGRDRKSGMHRKGGTGSEGRKGSERTHRKCVLAQEVRDTQEGNAQGGRDRKSGKEHFIIIDICIQ